MLAPSNGLLQTGLALKWRQIRLATRSYFRDRTNQATGALASHAIAAGLFAAAGIFALIACLVGIAALFRWIETTYGMFQAFGAIGGLLLLMSGLCAALAAGRLKRPSPHVPSLTSRLRVAIKANPLQPNQIDAARDTAAAILSAPSAPVTLSSGKRRRNGAARGHQGVRTGLIVMTALLGWAAARRRQQARPTVM